MTKRLYLSGPMTGIPEFNFPAFHRAAASLRASGYEVINPAELDAADTGPMTWEQYLRRDIGHLITCDGIALLPDYENSRGACLELSIAKQLGMEVMHLGKPATDGGIYAIVGPKGRLYIGQAQSFKRRWVEHRNALRRGRHHSVALQRAWDKYGEQAFAFAPMFIVPPGSRHDIEQSWFDALGRRLYNSALNARASQLGRKLSPETRKKMSAAHAGERNHNFGKAMPDAQKQKLSASRTGKHKGVESPHFGKAKTPEHRAKLSKALTGKLVGSRNPVARPVVCLSTGATFPTFAAAADWLRVNGRPKADHSTVRKAALGILKSAYGHKWALPGELHIAHQLGMRPIYVNHFPE